MNGELVGRIEAIVFAAGDSISVERIAQSLEISSEQVWEGIDALKLKYSGESGVYLLSLENSVQMCTNSRYAVPVKTALELKRNTPLSQAAMEVLAIIAYNQPVTKSFVEQIRGVDCAGVVGSLIQKGLLEERGRLELPGRPLLYGTTDVFLRVFGISSLEELPPPPDDPEQYSSEETQGGAD